MRRRHTLTLASAGLAATVLGSLGLAGCSRREAAPALGYTLLGGRQASVQGLRGKVVLVNFWATSCTTCVQEMPSLIQAHQRFQSQGYDTLAVAMSYDNPAYVENFVRSRQLPFQVAYDKTGELAKGFGDVRLTPTSFLLDKQGRVVKKYVGAPDFDAYARLVGELLAEG